jgi:hypothetical protein
VSVSESVPDIAQSMIDAARAEVADRWPQLQLLAESQLRQLARSLTDIASWVQAGEVTEAHARQLVHMHQIYARQVIATVEGIGLLTAEQAIHAGVRVAAKALKLVLL